MNENATYLSGLGTVDAEALHQPEDLLVGLGVGSSGGRGDAGGYRDLHPPVPLYLGDAVPLARFEHQHLAYQRFTVWKVRSSCALVSGNLNIRFAKVQDGVCWLIWLKRKLCWKYQGQAYIVHNVYLFVWPDKNVSILRTSDYFIVAAFHGIILNMFTTQKFCWNIL